MNIRRPHILRAAAVTAACLAALCCNACRKTLTYDYRGIPVRVSFDWEGVGAKPEGMRVIFYPLDREGTPYVDNIAPDGGTVELPSGRYAVVMFNNDSETILIDGEKSFGTIRAYTRTVTTVDPSLANAGSDGGLLDARAETAAGIPVVNRPDKLFGVSIGELSVGGETSRGSEQALRVKPAALVSQYCLCQQVVGGEFVQRVRGAVAGVPCSIMLGSQRPVAAASYIPGRLRPNRRQRGHGHLYLLRHRRPAGRAETGHDHARTDATGRIAAGSADQRHAGRGAGRTVRSDDRSARTYAGSRPDRHRVHPARRRRRCGCRGRRLGRGDRSAPAGHPRCAGPPYDSGQPHRIPAPHNHPRSTADRRTYNQKTNQLINIH